MSTVRSAVLQLAFAATVLSPVQLVAAAELQPQQQTCAQELDVLSGQWNAAGLPIPTKPGQTRVAGRLGHTHTAGEVDFMRGQLGAAARFCKAGQEHEAMLRMDAVRAIMKFAEVAHPPSHRNLAPRS